jgi:hypothetical protein
VAVLTWVGVAAFVTPGGTSTTTTGALGSDGSLQPFGNGSQAPLGNGSAGGFLRRGTTGTIQSVHGATLTVVDRQGQPITVTTSPGTVFTKTVAGSARDVRKGDRIVATGVLADANDTLTAGRIAVLGSGPAPGTNPLAPSPAGVASGTVTAAAGDRLTISEADGTAVTVVLAPSTAVTVTAAGSIGDLKTGQTVVVRGAVNPDSSIVASTVQQGGVAGGFGGGSFSRSFSGGTGSSGSFGSGGAGQP